MGKSPFRNPFYENDPDRDQELIADFVQPHSHEEEDDEGFSELRIDLEDVMMALENGETMRAKEALEQIISML